MTSISFQTAAVAIAQIFAMGWVGFFFVRRRIINEDGLKLLSFLSVNLFFPLFIFTQIIRHFNPAKISFWWGYPLINITLIMVGLAIASFVCWVSRKPPKDEFLAASSMHNAGYIPLLMAMTLPLGDVAGQVYAAVIMSIIGFDLCLWSIGVWLITRKQKPCMDLKSMINPPLISMLGAVLVVLLGAQGLFTETVIKPIRILGDAAMALSMMIIGGNLALTNFKNINVKSIGGAILLKLLALPAVTLTALLFIKLDPIMTFVVILQSCMPTSITLSIIGRHYDTKNQEFINQSIFLTHLLCALTLPVFLGLYGKLVH